MTPELIGNEAMAYYHAGNQSKAMDTFSQLIDPENLTLQIPLSGKARVEMLNLMTLSTLKQPKKNLDQVLTLWEAGLSGAQALQSNQRFNESSSIYDAIEAVWPNEPRVKERRKQLVHWAK